MKVYIENVKRHNEMVYLCDFIWLIALRTAAICVSLKDPNIVGDYCEHEEKKLVFVLHSMGEFGIFKDRGNVFTLIEHKY